VKRFLKNTFVRRLFYLLSFFILANVVFWGVFVYLFIPLIPAPDFPKPGSDAEAYRQDLEYLKRFPDYDRSFSEGSKREDFIRYIESLEARDGEFSEAEFELLVARALAIAGNGHTNVSAKRRSERLDYFPVRFASFREGIYVLQAYEEHADLLGTRVESLDGVPSNEIVEDLLPYFGGREERSRFFAALNMASPSLLRALGVGDSGDPMTVAFSYPDGKITTRKLAAVPNLAGERQPFGIQIYDHEPVAGVDEQWVALMKAREAPAFLKNAKSPYDRMSLQDVDGYYIRIDYTYDSRGQSLSAFLDDTIDTLLSAPPEFVVVDLRFNDGGTSTLKRFAKTLPSCIQDDGTIYVITSPGTFSYGIAAAVLLKVHGGEKVRIVGESVGDHLRFWANGGTTFRLPNSGITMRAWSSVEDYSDGCWDWTKCFWFSPTFRWEGPGADVLSIDIPVAMSFDDYVAGRDSILEAIIAHVRNER